MQGLRPDIYHDYFGCTPTACARWRSATLRPRPAALRLPYDTTRGPRTIEQLINQNPRPVRYVGDADTAALKEIAIHTGALLVNASGVNEAELLDWHGQRDDAHFLE